MEPDYLQMVKESLQRVRHNLRMFGRQQVAFKSETILTFLREARKHAAMVQTAVEAVESELIERSGDYGQDPDATTQIHERPGND